MLPPTARALLVCLLSATAVAEPPLAPSGAPLTFESSELRELAGTGNEPFRALLLLPGVSHVVSGAGLPVVRGAAPSATAFYVDGVRVPHVQHLWVGPATVNPELLAGLDFYSGPAPARFGRDVGGLVDVRLLPPRAEGVHVAATLDLLTLGVLAQVPLPTTGTELTLSGRFASMPWLAVTLLNASRGSQRPALVLGLFDGQARVTQAVGRGTLRLLALGGVDDAGLTGPGDVVRGGVRFLRVDTRLTHPLAHGELEAALTWGQDTLSALGGGEASRVGLDLRERSLGGRLRWRARLGQDVVVETGADVERRHVDVAQTTSFRPGEAGDPGRPLVTTRSAQRLARTMLAGAYAQATWHPGRWRLTPGLRVDGYRLAPGVSTGVVEPRLHARMALSARTALRLGAGVAHQAPAHLVDAPGVEAAALRLGLQRVVQVDAGADILGPAGFTFGAGVFVQPAVRTVTLDARGFDLAVDDPAARGRLRTAEGQGHGVELLVRRALSERWAVLGAYTYQRRTLDTRVERRDDTGRGVATDVRPVASPLEQAHVLNAALTVKLPWGLTVGTTLHVNTGAPEAGGLLFSATQRAGVDAETGAPRWIPEDRDRVARLPAYVRVDGRVSKAGRWGPLEMEAWLDVLNLSLTRETFRYTYGVGPRGLVRAPSGLPPITLPSLGVRARY